MRASGLPLDALAKSAFLKHLQHRSVTRQYLCCEFAQSCRAGNQSQMTHQSRTNALALISVNNHEGDLAYSGRRDDVASTTNNDWLAVIFRNRDQGNVIGEIDIREKTDFVFGEVPLYSEKSSVKRLRAGAVDGLNQAFPIAGPKRANFYAASISQRLDGRIFCSIRRGRLLPLRVAADCDVVRSPETEIRSSDKSMMILLFIQMR